MSAKIIDGKKIAADTRREISEECAQFEKEYGFKPGLAVIIVGENPASKVYVKNKHKACGEVGMYSEVIEMSSDVTKEQLISKIEELNSRDDIHGILVQLPLPEHLKENDVIAAINPEKDVDAFHLINTGKIMNGEYDFLPCTPAGVMKMLEYEGVEISGKECVVVGRSNIVGKPQAMMLLHANGTVTICHSKTKNLADVTRRADILVVAIGRAEFITGDMVKPGAVVIDVGMNRDKESGKLLGDCEYSSVSEVASMITPVPGGVGPMTITMLLRNTLTAAKRSVILKK